jgi:cell division protein FtsB
MAKHPSQRPFYLRPLPIAVTLAVMVYAVWFVAGNNGLYQRSKTHEVWLKQAEEIRFREAQQKKLEEKVAALRDKDDAAMEAAAREHGLVAPDENIYEYKLPDSTAKKN